MNHQQCVTLAGNRDDGFPNRSSAAYLIANNDAPTTEDAID